MKSVICLSLMSVMVCCFGCTKKSQSSNENSRSNYSGPPVKNDWLVARTPANPTTLNPIIASDGYATSVVSNIFESLISYDVKTGDPLPYLAKSWKISPDGLQYTFQLRSDVKFHDGSPLTAEDVKFSFDAIKDPKVDAAHRQNYFKNLVRTEVLGPHEVRFILNTPYYRNLIMLGLSEIIPKSVYGQGDFNKNPANRAPVGSGAYRFVKWDTGRLIELERVPDHWSLNDPYWKDRFNFNKILIRVITEDTAAGLSLKNGEIDTLDPTPEQFTKEFVGPDFEKNFYRLQYTTDDGNGYRFIGWNMRKPLFQSKNVRQALAYAMPRDKINQSIYSGMMQNSVGTFPVQSPKTDQSLKPIPYDLGKALELLEADGWKDTDGDGLLDKAGRKFEFELLYGAQSSDLERMMILYQESLKRLGVGLKLKTLEWTVFVKNIQDRNFEAMMMAWGSSLDGDPYQLWHSSQAKDGSNYSGFINERADKIMDEARVTLDRDKRNALFREFSKILADEAPYLFIFERPRLEVISKRFEGVLPVERLGLDSSKFFTPPGREKYGAVAK